MRDFQELANEAFADLLQANTDRGDHLRQRASWVSPRVDP
jgi:hypothetical protein